MAKLWGNLTGKVKKQTYQNLRELLSDKRFKLPSVVTVKTSAFGNDSTEQDNEIFLFLEKETTLRFALCEVIELPTQPGENNDDNIRERRHVLVGNEVLIPLTFQGPLTTLNRSFKHQLYTSIKELPDPPPKTIDLAEDLLLSTLDEKNAVLKKKGTRLVIDHKLHGAIVKLVVRDNVGNLFAIKETTPIQISAIPPAKYQQLSGFIASTELPKIVTFSDIVKGDVISADKDSFHTLSLALAGPIRVNGIVDTDVVIGWMEENGKCLLIPQYQTVNIMAKQCIFNSRHSQIYDRFRHCDFTKMVSSKLYIKDLNEKRITSIRANLGKIENDYTADPTNMQDPNVLLLPEKELITLTERHDEIDDASVAQSLGEECHCRTQGTPNRNQTTAATDNPYANYPTKSQRPNIQDGISGNTNLSEVRKSVGNISFTSTGRKDAENQSGRAEEEVDSSDYGYAYLTPSHEPIYVNEQGLNDRICSSTFYDMSVKKVCQFLTSNGFHSLAHVCEEETLDGAFFKTFDLAALADEPFNQTEAQLSQFKILIGE